jgi:hypothetical protein
MKKHLSLLSIILGVALLAWGTAQNAQTNLFDLKKSQQELEIMKGILGTTLSFVAREIQNRSTGASAQGDVLIGSRIGLPDVSAFYLYGQGAAFIVPLSNLRFAMFKGNRYALARPYDDLNGLTAAYESQQALQSMLTAQPGMNLASDELVAHSHELEELAREQAEVTAALAGEKASTGVGIAQAPVPKTPKAPMAAATPATSPVPTKAATTQERREEMKKKLFEAQEKVKQRQQEFEAQQKKFMESLGEVKVYLIEALATHGDSLTHVKPNEYINLILTVDGFASYYGTSGTRMQREIISVQKSTIADFKASKITMDQFKQRVLQYGN